MAVSVSRDLKVQVQEDVNKVKLREKQQELRAAILRGEPKCLGVGQIMLGLMVISYSLPLHVTEATHVVNFGVPWWTGLTFIAAGSIAIVLDKHCTMKIMKACLIVSVASVVLSVVAVVIYSVDLNKYHLSSCEDQRDYTCTRHYFGMKISKGIKSSLLLFTLAETAISVVFSWILFRQRHNFEQYAALNHAASSLLN